MAYQKLLAERQEILISFVKLSLDFWRLFSNIYNVFTFTKDIRYRIELVL